MENKRLDFTAEQIIEQIKYISKNSKDKKIHLWNQMLLPIIISSTDEELEQILNDMLNEFKDRETFINKPREFISKISINLLKGYKDQNKKLEYEINQLQEELDDY